MYVSINGQLVSAADAKISVFDNAFLGGIAVYETMRTYTGRLFRTQAHFERLRKSADALGISCNFSDDDLFHYVRAVIDKNGFEESRIRLTLTQGGSHLYPVEGIESSLVIQVSELIAEPVTAVSVVLLELERIAPHVKSCNLLPQFLAGQAARKVGAFEALLVNHEGYITEGSFSNVFFVKGETLVTPAGDILFGITRQIVLEVAAQHAISVEERPVHRDELTDFDACFICNSVRGIVPVSEVVSLTQYSHNELIQKLTKLLDDVLRSK